MTIRLQKASLAFLLLALSSSACAQFRASSFPFVNEEVKSGIEKEYSAAKPQKALAITEAGTWQIAQGGADLETTTARALSSCQARDQRHPCFIAAENDQVVMKERYTPEAIYAGAIAMLKRSNLTMDYYSDENRDSGVAPTTSFRTRDVHAPTPLTVPGAKTITTKELVELLKTSKPVIVNVLPWKEGVFAIPGTVWLQGMGRLLYRSDMLDLQNLLATIAPDKSAPLVVYCLSWECWLSYNAALNALDLGYRNVLWYRGGGQAWDQANLPVVRTKLYKQF